MEISSLLSIGPEDNPRLASRLIHHAQFHQRRFILFLNAFPGLDHAKPVIDLSLQGVIRRQVDHRFCIPISVMEHHAADIRYIVDHQSPVFSLNLAWKAVVGDFGV